MSAQNRVLIAVAVLILDLVVFFLPLTAMAIAYCLIMRPAWLKSFIDGLYNDQQG